ncbi:MAG: hypothetical protein QOD07_2852, partial [Frankiaceae bacterium]|nr:hypothetical protein [Frankiaceae bacterium]
SMSGAGTMPDGVRLGGRFDPEETAADEVARRVVQQRPAGDDASIIAAARRAGANVPSGVRIHQGGRANAAAASMQASAFTVGSDVYLTDDAVRSPEQRIRVLAHELTHTGQDRGHGQRAPGGEPVVQRLWNPFKKKGPSRPSTGTDYAEEERETRRDNKAEERRSALSEAPTATTDLDSGLATGGHDASTYDIGSREVKQDANGTDLRGDDGWKQKDTSVSGSGLDDFVKHNKHDAENMGEAAGLNTTLAGDFGGGILGMRDAMKQKGVDGALAKTRAGALLGKGVSDGTSLGLQMTEHHGGSSLFSNDQLHTGSQAMDHGAGWMGGLAGGVGAMQDLKSWGKDTVDWFKGKRNMEKSDGTKLGDAKQVGLSMGRGVAKLGSATSKATGAVSKSANLVSQAAHGTNNLGLASNAASVGSSAAHVIAPLQMALGGVDVLKGGYNMFRKGQHRKKLTALKEEIKGDALDLDADKKVKALDHITEITKKKQVRSGINMATGAASVLGGALTVSGFGAIPGAAIGAGVGAFKLGQFGARKAKQAGRNWAEKYNAKDEKDKGVLGKAFAGIFDTSKSTANKQKRYEETADTLLDMPAAQRDKALKTLGIHDLASIPTAQHKELIVEKLKKRT